MRTAAQQAGDAAEQRVADHLRALGWIVLAMHVRVGRAELDIVAIDPGPPPALAIVEVRWRGRRDYGLPEETVNHRKRSLIHRAGFALRDAGHLPGGIDVPGGGDLPARQPLPNLPLRFDLIVVEPGDRLRHHRHGG
jgi:Holliday junction resolvase-like predicted endonuclease